ncbi:hypothetical protein FKW77_002690 [Venturia effusa]|uniref:Uncharacterized protein n=1 Tax=Venturia effusa TaxID=50376 RepID=A0A517LR05_9PEZI|nr:hypothetical protein FKW77_002690 [Venturia effusa]
MASAWTSSEPAARLVHLYIIAGDVKTWCLVLGLVERYLDLPLPHHSLSITITFAAAAAEYRQVDGETIPRRRLSGMPPAIIVVDSLNSLTSQGELVFRQRKQAKQCRVQTGRRVLHFQKYPLEDGCGP